jgi:predicted nucleic acid-binding protein
MKVVVNAGPVIALAKLGVLSLMRNLYKAILMPESVYHETVSDGLAQGYTDAYLIQQEVQRGYMQVFAVTESEIPKAILAFSIDRGERDAIYLAIREKADLVLMDDLVAREAARACGLKVRGTLGIIVQAYRNHLISIDEVRSLIETIMIRSDIWISKELCRQVLQRLQNESPQDLPNRVIGGEE